MSNTDSNEMGNCLLRGKQPWEVNVKEAVC